MSYDDLLNYAKVKPSDYKKYDTFDDYKKYVNAQAKIAVKNAKSHDGREAQYLKRINEYLKGDLDSGTAGFSSHETQSTVEDFFDTQTKEVDAKFKEAKSTIIKEARDIKTRSDTDKLYTEIERTVPEGPERDKQITELNDIVNSTFKSLNDEFINKVSQTDDIEELESMRSDAPTNDAEKQLDDQIAKLKQ